MSFGCSQKAEKIKFGFAGNDFFSSLISTTQAKRY